MQEPLPEGGTIRKLWGGEADEYREHLLRLDPESRYRRFMELAFYCDGSCLSKCTNTDDHSGFNKS